MKWARHRLPLASVQAAQVAWFDGENLAVEQLCFGKSTVTVVAQRRIEEIGDRGSRPDSRIRGAVSHSRGRGATLASVHFIAVTNLEIEIEQVQVGLALLNAIRHQ